MSANTNLVRSRARRLRDRALFREGDLEAAAMNRAGQQRRHYRVTTTPELFTEAPQYAQYLVDHDGWPPSVARGTQARQQRAHTMFERFGALVFMTRQLRHLDHLPLKSRELETMAVPEAESLLAEIAPGAVAYDYVIQRGGNFACTHVHLLIPLRFLHSPVCRQVCSQREGEGGGGPVCNADGVALLDHAVIVADSEEDRVKVSSYMGRDPDGRFDLPQDHRQFVQAHEEELARKASGATSPKLARYRLPYTWP